MRIYCLKLIKNRKRVNVFETETTGFIACERNFYYLFGLLDFGEVLSLTINPKIKQKPMMFQNLSLS